MKHGIQPQHLEGLLGISLLVGGLGAGAAGYWGSVSIAWGWASGVVVSVFNVWCLARLARLLPAAVPHRRWRLTGWLGIKFPLLYGTVWLLGHSGSSLPAMMLGFSMPLILLTAAAAYGAVTMGRVSDA